MMEYAEHGDLFDTVLKPDHNEVRAARFLRDVLRGVQYIHSLGVIHRDIKAENVVLTSSNSCKVVDFGFPTRLPRGAKSLNDHLVVGTIDYLSPEIIRKRPYNHCVDIWALGVCRHVPFAPRSNMMDSAFARRAVVTKVNPVCATTDRVMTKESLILSYSREACMEGAPATRPGAQSETPRYPSPTSADCVTGTTRITRSGHHSGTHTTGAPSPHVACTPSPGHMSAAASPREFAPGSAGSVGQSGYNFDVRLRPSISPIPAAVTREDSGSYLYEVTGAVANLQVSATVADHIPTSGNDVSQCERELECERPPSGTHNQSVRKADSKNP
eukprot:374332_1